MGTMGARGLARDQPPRPGRHPAVGLFDLPWLLDSLALWRSLSQLPVSTGGVWGPV